VILADLIGFFKDPVKGFYRALEFTLPQDVDGVKDAMPVNLDNLEEWSVGDRMLADLSRGMTAEQAREAEWRRGTLPPGNLGWRLATEICDHAVSLANCAQQYRTSEAKPYDVDIDLGGGRRLSGTAPAVYGSRLVSVTYSKLDGKHLMASWIPLLALYARDSRQGWSAACIGRDKEGTAPRIEEIGRPDGDAVEVLRDMVAIYDAGRREPLPLPVKTSHAYAAARFSGKDPEKAAKYRWHIRDYGEDTLPAHVRAWGKNAWLSDLMTSLRPGEEFDSEDHRLGAYSCRMWMPMLRAERIPS
jgi:exodeoxyribonuclease V gamma subunit